MLLREATSETSGPRVYSHHINLHHFNLALLFTLSFTFHFASYIKNTKNIIYPIYQISLTEKGLTTPNRVGCVELLFCVGTRDLSAASYWIDTLVLKN
jgi:hypothetical protein